VRSHPVMNIYRTNKQHHFNRLDSQSYIPIIDVMQKLISFISILVLVLLSTMCSKQETISKPVVKRVTSEKTPIILIHGFNQGSDFWNDIGLIDELKSAQTIKMGSFYPSIEKPTMEIIVRDPQDIASGQSAVYTLSLQESGTVDIRDSATLLEKSIQHVIDRHECQKVRLVSFSAGGVVSREYIQRHPQEHRVASLTTVSAPHLGSEHAWLAVSYNNLKKSITKMNDDDSGNFVSQGTRTVTAFTLNKITDQLEDWGDKAGIDISSKCALMLAEPENDNYLDSLSKANYPYDINYHCIITEENILNYSFQKLKSDYHFIKSGDFSNTAIADNLLDLARNGLGKLDKITAQFTSLKFRGDGVVSNFSQNLNNTVAFKNNSELNAGITHLEADHGGQAITKAILENLSQLEE